jgi:hypothetical protein
MSAGGLARGDVGARNPSVAGNRAVEVRMVSIATASSEGCRMTRARRVRQEEPVKNGKQAQRTAVTESMDVRVMENFRYGPRQR